MRQQASGADMSPIQGATSRHGGRSGCNLASGSRACPSRYSYYREARTALVQADVEAEGNCCFCIGVLVKSFKSMAVIVIHW